MATKIVESKFKRRKPSKNTKVIIIGISPGKQQIEVLKSAKKARDNAFLGNMRKNIFHYFQKLGLNQFLNIEHADSIFKEKSLKDVIAITSLIRDHVEVNGKNYSGHSPKPWNDSDLKERMLDTMKYLEKLPSNTLIIPLGKAVEQSLMKYLNQEENNFFILKGFPHPSGANGHRTKKFNENRRKMRKIIEKWKISQNLYR